VDRVYFGPQWFADIYRAHPDGTGLERLTNDPSFDDQAALSLDGGTVAFVSSGSGHAELWTLDLATRAVRNITNHAGGHFRPAWSPDGQWIAISSDRDSPKPQRPDGFEHCEIWPAFHSPDPRIAVIASASHR
jgi:Tol biopolymer transport system component